MSTAGPGARREQLVELFRTAEKCTKCPLHEDRIQVVFGAGDADADLMFVGEAPGAEEDRLGMPFVGRSGGVLDQLLEGIGISRDDVFIANVVKCRPPDNRDPSAMEIETCSPYLERQIELVQPHLICTLGNFATKLLSADKSGITKVHGQVTPTTFGSMEIVLYPMFHPAAALRSPSYADGLRDDFKRIPALLGDMETR